MKLLSCSTREYGGGKTRGKIVMKFCTAVVVPNISSHANFSDYRFRRFGESGGRISHLSIACVVGLKTLWHYCTGMRHCMRCYHYQRRPRARCNFIVHHVNPVNSCNNQKHCVIDARPTWLSLLLLFMSWNSNRHRYRDYGPHRHSVTFIRGYLELWGAKVLACYCYIVCFVL